ncbi:MAG TPA: methionyl-tRNA formyltransferase [Acidimicrobiales bacterium]|nr:methionyl-tRNA formyltransferase [Acidimicrobiales bacterium]
MRLVFLGTPEPAAAALRSIVAAGHDVALVVTRADKRRGRNAAPSPSPVKATAVELGLPVTTRIEDVLDAGAKLGVVVAFGRIIKDEILDQMPMVNAHFSLLPRWRGAAPVERAVLAGDTETGVCLMAIDAGLDTGPVYRCEKVSIGSEETADQLRERLSELSARMLVEALETGLGEPVPQEGEPTYAAKLEPAELHLNWERPAAELHRVVRVGRAWTSLRGRRLLVLEARVVDRSGGAPGSLDGSVVSAGDGGLELLRVQPEGRPALPAVDWLRGARPAPGEVLGA